MYAMFQIIKAAVGRCFSKYVLLKSLQNYRKIPVLECLFNKVADF